MAMWEGRSILKSSSEDARITPFTHLFRERAFLYIKPIGMATGAKYHVFQEQLFTGLSPTTNKKAA